MPVKFKGASEYTDNYPEFQSYKSASFQPSPEQAARSAGLQTAQSALVFEPQLQRKKKVIGPTESLSADYFDSLPNGQSSEYALLGQQEKFASNVKYRPKSSNINNNRTAPPPKQLKLDRREPNPNKEEPKPAPVVDTQKFREPSTPPTPLAPRKPKESKDIAPEPKKTKAIQTQPKAKTVQTQDKSKDESVLPMKQKELPKESDPVKEGLKDKNLSDVLGEMKKKKASMNEFTQTNVEKGVVDSAPEAPAEYAMKYKAGMAPPRASRKQSEYQREFEWKNKVAASPMLAAEQVVYNSKVGPVKTSGFPKTSEYKAQFKKWKAIENEPVPAVKHAAQQRAAMKNRAMKRSKSVGAVDRRRADREAPEEDEDAKQEVPKPLPHHGKLRKVVTEYAANFKPPQKFSYEKGAWKGADPPHLYAQKQPEPEPGSKEPALSNWFAEVLELRRKAAEYKKRAQGTHFSREHLVQLLAKQAGFWDIPTARSESSSTLSALSLEAGNSDVVRQQQRKQKKTKKDFSERNLVDFDSCHATIADSENQSEPDAEVNEESVPVQKKGTTRNMNRKMAWLEEHQKTDVEDRLEEDVERIESPSSDVTQEGRLPTPLWRQSIKAPKKPRHHLDRTTPSVGGAILTSPPQPFRSKTFASESSQDTNDEESERREFRKTYNLNRLRTTPTFGHPSQDTHALRDDDASVDRPMKATYMYMPAEEIGDLEQENKEPVVEPPVRRQSRRKEKMRPAGIPSTLHEQMGETYNKPVFQPPPDDDDDNVSLSLSVRSIASSCSLASDVYQRAKNRRDNFWGKGDVAAR